MKDSVSSGADLVAAVLALIYLFTADAVVRGVSDTAFGAGWHITVPGFKDMLQATAFVGETVVELFKGELHITSVVQGLHDVKG